MPLLTGAQTLVLGLEKMGTKRIYGIIGTSILGFYEGLYEARERIRYISCRHEQVAASIAEVEGRLTGRPGVAIVHSGPGALNAMISLGNAYKDCSPMILITGAVKSRLKGTDGMLELDHPKVFSSIVKGAYRVERTREIPRILSEAYRASLSGAWGPVVIEVPEQVWKERDEIDQAFVFEVPPVPQADPSSIEEVLGVLSRARRPLILAGCGVAYSGSHGFLKELVELLKVPVVTTGNGRGVLPEDHPLSLGRVGFGGGNPVADQAFQKCDLLLGLGATVSDMVTYEFTQETGADIYLVNLDPVAKDRKVFVEKNFICDVASFLSLLVQGVKEKKIGPLASWIDQLAADRTIWRETLDAAAGNAKSPLSPSYVFSRLGRMLPRDAIVAGGAGMHVVYAHDYLPALGPRQFLAAVNFGAMGLSLPAAMAAKLVHPDRVVVAVAGDGDLLMTIQDLETVVREKIGVKLAVVNDNSYRVLEFKQKLQFQGHVIGTRHQNPDFMRLAEAFGLKGIRLERPEEVEKGLADFMKSKGPVLLEIVTDPEDLPPTNLEAALKMGQA